MGMQSPDSTQSVHPSAESSQHEEKSDSKLARTICKDDLTEEEKWNRTAALLARHPEALSKGLSMVFRSNSLWRRSAEKLGYQNPQSTVPEAVDYLLSEGNHDKQRICTFLEDPRPFQKWLSITLRYLAYDICEEIKNKASDLKEQEALSDPQGPTLTGQSSYAASASTNVGYSEIDQLPERVKKHTADAFDRAADLIEGLDHERTNLMAGFFSDRPSALELSSEMEECLLRIDALMEEKDIEPRNFGIEAGKSELWNCVREISGLCQTLVVGRYFMNLEYWKLGRLYSKNSADDYDSNDQYRRAEYDWARFRIKNKCRDKVESLCSQSAADYM